MAATVQPRSEVKVTSEVDISWYRADLYRSLGRPEVVQGYEAR